MSGALGRSKSGAANAAAAEDSGGSERSTHERLRRGGGLMSNDAARVWVGGGYSEEICEELGETMGPKAVKISIRGKVLDFRGETIIRGFGIRGGVGCLARVA